MLTDHFSQNHILKSPNSPVLQGKVERGSTGIESVSFNSELGCEQVVPYTI